MRNGYYANPQQVLGQMRQILDSLDSMKEKTNELNKETRRYKTSIEDEISRKFEEEIRKMQGDLTGFRKEVRKMIRRIERGMVYQKIIEGKKL